MTAADFTHVLAAGERFVRAGGQMPEEKLMSVASHLLRALSTLDVSEDFLRSMMEEAGSMLREQRLSWLNSTPDFLITGPESSPSVAVNYRIDVQARQAAELTWALAERWQAEICSH